MSTATLMVRYDDAIETKPLCKNSNHICIDVGLNTTIICDDRDCALRLAASVFDYLYKTNEAAQTEEQAQPEPVTTLEESVT